MKKNSGYSLIEILVVIAVFAIISILLAQSVVTSLRGAKRTDSDTRVRESLDYAMSIMERHLRNARTINCSSPTNITYTDFNGISGSFYLDGSISAIASVSASARLTGPEVSITALNFTCTPSVGNVPTSVDITATGQISGATGVDRSPLTTSTKVLLRSNY